MNSLGIHKSCELRIVYQQEDQRARKRDELIPLTQIKTTAAANAVPGVPTEPADDMLPQAVSMRSF